MTEYLLFIDTEASGLPKNWDLPYSVNNNWPFCVQLAWIIYTRDGKQIKQEDHYIKDNDFRIRRSAQKIHGITREFLDANGESRKEVMKLLSEDFLKYKPLVAGHFMEFDLHMLGVDFYRACINNPLKKEDTFCTMLATTSLVKNPGLKYFNLGQLFETLFNTPLKNPHNALVDAKATADCFFELVKREIISDKTILLQQSQVKKTAIAKTGGCFILILIIIIWNVLIFYNL